MRSRIWLALLVSTLAQADRCDPPAQIVQFLTTLPDDNRERHKMIGERVKSSPNDFWLNRLFLDGSRYEGSAIRDRYLVWFETNRNIENKYLYGRSLVGFETKQALRVYSEILAQEPDNPWVHNSQIEIYRTPSFRDRSKLRSSFEAVTQTCPSWIEPYRYLTDLDDDSLPSHAAKLRTMLEQSTNPRDVRLYSVLWAAEFRLKQPNENTLIAADLKRLRAIDGARATIAAGARLIGDDALAREMSPQTVDVRQQQDAWQRSHPYPQPGDPPDKRRAYAQAALEASNRWIAEAPNRISSYWQRFGALEMLDAPAEQIAGAAEDVVRVARADDRASGPSYIAAVAQRYVDRGIQLDRVPVLIDEALTSLDDPEAVIQTDFDPGQDDINAENKM
jgi:hypothetical protein